jgi:DNA transposition AAA+ family ATPase
VSKPNAENFNPNPKYLRKLVEASGLSQVRAAKRIGVSDRTMRAWLAGDQDFPYTAQYALEQLAKSK